MLFSAQNVCKIGDGLVLVDHKEALPLAGYLVQVRGCNAKFCGCGNVSLMGFDLALAKVHEKEENPGDIYAEWSVEVSILTMLIRFDDTEPEYHAVAHFLDKHLTEKDWVQLSRESMFDKGIMADNDIIDSSIHDLIDDPIAVLETAGDDFLAFAAFAPSSFIFKHVDQKDYLLIDTYCYSPLCRCTSVKLSIYLLGRDDDTWNGTEIGIATFDYTIGDIAYYIAAEPAYEPQLESLFADIGYDDLLAGRFSSRHDFVREFIVAFGPDAPPRKNTQPMLRVASKIGRNDPCICGSGKKYKKCCGK